MSTAEEMGFSKFSELATELRLKIWHHALPDAKVVEIEWCDKLKAWVCPDESQAPVSSLASTTAESREVYLKYYQPFLVRGPSSHGQGTCRHGNCAGPKTYIDPTIDIIYIGANSENEYCFCPRSLAALKKITILSNIQVLACELKEWIDGTEEYDSQPYAAYSFPDKFILVWGDIDYERFEKSGKRPAGEIKFIEISAEEEASDRIQGLKEVYEKEMLDTKSYRAPPMTLMRLSRGGTLMAHALGLQ